MPKGRRVARRRAKRQSDIFICGVGPDDYWAYPSPFVAHRAGTTIQFRNLTNEPLEIDMQATPVTPTNLSVAPHGSAFVTVNKNARAGFHRYRADALAPAPASSGGKVGPKAYRYVAVKGGSPPEIIIDT